MLACKRPDGLYNLFNYQTGAPILNGVDQACLNQFGDVTMAQEGDTRCGGESQTGAATGACALPKDKKFVMCPPSNGVTVNYFLDVDTAGYIQNMTTQSPECANQENVIRVGANSPYCGGSNVQGAGSGPPQLVACFKQAGMTHEEAIVDIHNGPDYALLASDVLVKDIPTRFPGKRWIMVTGPFCSALPDFGMGTVAAPPPPTTTTPTAPTIPPGGLTVPTTPLQEAQAALPPRPTQTYPTTATGASSGAPFRPPPTNLIPPPMPVQNGGRPSLVPFNPPPPSPPPPPRQAPPAPAFAAPPPPPAPLLRVPCPYSVMNVTPWAECLIRGA